MAGCLGRPIAVTWSMCPLHWRMWGKRSLSREPQTCSVPLLPWYIHRALALRAKGKQNCSNALVKLCSRLIKFYTGFECYCSEMVIRGNEKPPGETVKMTFCEPSQPQIPAFIITKVVKLKLHFPACPILSSRMRRTRVMDALMCPGQWTANWFHSPPTWFGEIFPKISQLWGSTEMSWRGK